MVSPLTTAIQVRGRIQDPHLRHDMSFDGDGRASAFALPHRNVQSASAFVYVTAAGGTPLTGWSATGATFDGSGFVTFDAVPSAASSLRAVYVHSTFSDDEIGHFTAVGGSVVGAAIEAVRWLRFDGLKRAAWAAGDGTTFDDTKAIAELDRIEKALIAERDEGEIGGALYGWGETQGDFK